MVRGDEEPNEGALLVASRKDDTCDLKLLHYDCHPDVPHGWSRVIVCEVRLKQGVGHLLGPNVVVCGVHGHHRTMKREWPPALTRFWDRLAGCLRKFGINFIAGNFDMSLTEVPKQMRSRGILCDCAAWYP